MIKFNKYLFVQDMRQTQECRLWLSDSDQFRRAQNGRSRMLDFAAHFNQVDIANGPTCQTSVSLY